MAQKKSLNIDFSALQEKIQRQFRNLDPNDPSVWPALPKALLYAAVAIAVAALLWFVVLKDYEAELEQERATEVTLREDYQLLFLAGQRPIVAAKLKYYADREFAGRFDKA